MEVSSSSGGLPKSIQQLHLIDTEIRKTIKGFVNLKMFRNVKSLTIENCLLKNGEEVAELLRSNLKKLQEFTLINPD